MCVVQNNENNVNKWFKEDFAIISIVHSYCFEQIIKLMYIYVIDIFIFLLGHLIITVLLKFLVMCVFFLCVFLFLISISLFSGRLTVIEKSAEFISVMAGANKVTVHAIPFRVDLFSGDQLVISVNARGLMRFEHIRPKPEQ